MRPLDLAGAWLFTPHLYQDRRGTFYEWFSNVVLEDSMKRRLQIAQANCSVSRRGVIRGIHFADVPPGQAKWITCTSGAILDVIVDVRVGSPSFGQWTSAELNAENKAAVFIEEGLGHGFSALTEQATVFYLSSAPYDPELEHGINPLDPGLGIQWPAAWESILSDKDAAAPTLAKALAGGMLPAYSRCQRLIRACRVS
ncbi:MAG TPA: dTDP-4-dehydrorhamnose 3,5-epimerase [Streptosporangiaceae bacterium]|nr:dTDP-4-dehydrorhamnose 3,5-epimerase [Streptosporangiaceae bacterium]